MYVLIAKIKLPDPDLFLSLAGTAIMILGLIVRVPDPHQFCGDDGQVVRDNHTATARFSTNLR